MANILKSKTNPYGEWLGQYEWDYFCTFTTRYPLTLKSARRLMYRFFDMRASADKNSPRLIERMFWAAEPFDTREGYHTHGLMRIRNDLAVTVPFKMITEMYQVAAGNADLEKSKWHRIQLRKYNKKLGATYYCGKYITKELSDYDMYSLLTNVDNS